MGESQSILRRDAHRVVVYKHDLGVFSRFRAEELVELLHQLLVVPGHITDITLVSHYRSLAGLPRGGFPNRLYRYTRQRHQLTFRNVSVRVTDGCVVIGWVHRCLSPSSLPRENFRSPAAEQAGCWTRKKIAHMIAPAFVTFFYLPCPIPHDCLVSTHYRTSPG